MGVGALALGIWALYQGRKLNIARDWRHFSILGVVNSALPFLLFGYAAQTFSASLLSIFNATTPIYAGALGAVWLKRKVSALGWFGMAVGVAGVAMIGAEGFAVKNDNVLGALVACFVAPLSYGFASLYATRHADTTDPLDNAHGSLWVGTLLLMPLAVMSPAPLREPALMDWLTIAMLGLGCTSFAYLLFFRLLVEIGPVKALSVTFLIPLFGVFWGWLFLGEQVTGTMMAGGALVLVGSALIHMKKST